MQQDDNDEQPRKTRDFYTRLPLSQVTRWIMLPIQSTNLFCLSWITVCVLDLLIFWKFMIYQLDHPRK
jgi:hypothetical protein